MTSLLRTVLATATIAILSGCAGTNFKRPDPGALELGRSTSAQIAQVMGGPAPQTGEVLRNEQKLKSARYAYAEGAGTGKYPGVVPARAMGFLTFNDVLVAQEFVSSFPNDATDFDESKVSSIVKGKTTKPEVVSLLGNPNGHGIYPFIKKQGETAYVYSYSHAKGNAFNMKFYSKSLVVSFDATGVVSDVEYTSNGDK
jgi:outer membrane protein assembly factor BamE (lipoprotein component of BamABCDE complex)